MLTIAIIAFAVGCVLSVIYVTKSKQKGIGRRKLRSASRLRALQQKNLARQDADPSIEDVQVGGVIHLADVGLRSESFDAQIVARHLHKLASARIPELVADRGGSHVYISLERDDELSINVTMAQPPLEELGISARDLDDFRDDQTLTYDGTEFFAADNGRAVFCRDGNELQPEKYDFWEFEDEEAEQYLTLARWEDGTVEASYSVEVQPSQITVYSRTE